MIRVVIQMLFFIFIVKPFLFLFIGLRAYGIKNLKIGRNFILIANHSSHLDTVALLNLFSLKELRNIRPVAAVDYFERNKIISFLTHTFFNILPISRKHITKQNNPIIKMREALEVGQSLIIFPEGTRSLDNEIHDFNSGIMHLIKENESIPIIPVYLSNLWRSLPKGYWVPVPFYSEIVIGEPIYMKDNNKDIEFIKNAVLDLKKSYEEKIKSIS